MMDAPKPGSSSHPSTPQPLINPSLTPSVAVIGLWHQGVVGAACLADLGYDVLAADANAETVAGLQAGRAPLFEPGLDDLLQKGLAAGNLRFTSDIADAVKDRKYVLVMHDTPVDENDQSDLSPILDAVRAFAPNLRERAVILVTAQVRVGTCDELCALVRETNPDAVFGLAYSPENLRLGQAIERFMAPPLPVIGADYEVTHEEVEKLLAPLNVEWQRVSLRTGEMVKHGLNAFLATSIVFGNELGNLCDAVGADGKRLAEILRLEPRIGSKAMLLPGLAFSGGTIARDVQTLRALGGEHELPTHFLDGVWEANRLQNRVIARKLRKALGSLDGKRIAVLGLTYKPDTSTLRRSASLEVIAELAADGAHIAAHDPKADRAEVAGLTGFDFCEDVYDAVKDADALVLVTPWPDYKALDYQRVHDLMCQPVMVDGSNFLDADAMQSLGFTYFDIGRGRG